jgi:hypothetical protein
LSDRWEIIGINQYGNHERVAVEHSKKAAQDFIDSQRTGYTYKFYGYDSNFKHTHILRWYVDAIVKPYNEMRDERDT